MGTNFSLSRRLFFQKASAIGATAALSSLLRGQPNQDFQVGPIDQGTGKKVRVGVIGAENSHTVTFARTFNIEKKFPGVEVVALWGERPEWAEAAAAKGQIPKIVKEPLDLLGQIDALIIDHRHAKYHVQAAIPFVEAGIPTFVDKPFSYRVEEGVELLELAKEYKTPITSLSTVGYGPEVDDLKEQVEALPEIYSVVMTGRADIKSKYGGVFFYGIHMVERLFAVVGNDAVCVRATRHGDRTTVQLKFESGLLATLILEAEIPGSTRDLLCVTKEGTQKVEPRISIENGLYCYADIVRMFQTGEEPRSHESIIRAIAALEATERSLSSEGWEYLTV